MDAKKLFKQSEKDRVYAMMQEVDPTSGEYQKLLDTYLKLSDDSRKDGLSIDTAATIAANLLGIGLILKHEELHVIATKAMNFVVRGRL